MFEGKWDWDYISIYINIQEVIKNPHMHWNKEWLSENKGITIDMMNIIDSGHGLYRVSYDTKIKRTYKYPNDIMFIF